MSHHSVLGAALDVEHWPDVDLVRVCHECDGGWPTQCKLRPYFSRQPSHVWCRQFAERCEADTRFARWRHGAAYCSADDIAVANRAFFELTHETNAWFRRYLARMAAERPRHAQRLLRGEGARDGESHVHDAHPYPAI